MLQAGGLDGNEANAVRTLLSAVTVGVVLIQQGQGSTEGASTPATRLTGAVKKVDAAELPTLAVVGALDQLVSGQDTDYEHLLGLVIAGISAHATATPSGPGARRRK